jgi:ABC-type transport system involved in multi-copper enzyme maturation permease subunit
LSNMVTLISYEYKKILKRKSSWISLVFALGLTLISCFGDNLGMVYVEGKPVYSHYEEFLTDRGYARTLSGQEIDSVLISEMQKAYGHVPDVPLYSASEEYQTYARPYSTIYHLVRMVAVNALDAEGTPVNVMKFDESQYYELRNKAIMHVLEQKNLSTAEVKKHLEMNDEIKTPFIFQYTNGYDSIMSRMYTIGIILIMTLIICLAPVFAYEYAEKTDQLILSSKYGKNKEILAKLITGISFGIIVTVAILLVQIIPTLIFYGFDGWNAPIQLLNVTSTYPLTVLKGMLLLCGMSVIASIFMSCLTLFLSARLKSAFAVIVILSTGTIFCMFLRVPEQYRFLYQLINTLPMNIMSEKGTLSDYFFVLSGKCFTVYQMVPVIYAFLMAVLLAGTYRCFKRHQIQ